MSSASQVQDKLAWNFYRNPRWAYDDFVPNYILKPLKLRFIQRHYDRPLKDFVNELPELMHRFTTIPIPGGSAWFAETIKLVQKCNIKTLFVFLDEVATRAQAEGFLGVSGIPQPNLIGMMDYLKQWWFPYPATLRQLVQDDDPVLLGVLAKLKAAKIANSLTMLDVVAEPQGRIELARKLGIAKADLLDLVHRADVSRLPYVSGGAVKRLWVMGYRSLTDIRTADPVDYSTRIEAFFAAGGKGTPFDARMSIIQGFLADARHAPMVVQMD